MIELENLKVDNTIRQYNFRCMAWKNQNRPVDSRTCKHLKEHLGEKFEAARCDLGSDGGTSSGKVSRSPVKAKAIPQLLLANKWTERYPLISSEIITSKC